MKMKVVILEGAEVVKFLDWVASVEGRAVLRVGMDEEGVKLKADNGLWSPGIGQMEE